MNGKALHASLHVLLTGQLTKISTKIDRYHKLVHDGFTDELRQTIRVLQAERKDTNDRYDGHMNRFRQEIMDRDQALSDTRDTVKTLQKVILDLEKDSSTWNERWSCLNTLYIETKQRVVDLDLVNSTLVDRSRQLSDDYDTWQVQAKTLTDVEKKLSTTTQELNMSQAACLELRAQIPWLQRTLSKQAKQSEDTDKHIAMLSTANTELLAENQRLLSENETIPSLLETARWFRHFLPSIDVTNLKSVPKVGHAQEIATHTLLQTMFGDQFYAINVVSNRGHRGDIHIQPEKGGPSIIVEVKTYLPSSKGTMRNGKIMHEVPSKMGRQKLIDDMNQNRLQGCLAAVMVVHENQYIPTIDFGDGNTVIVDYEHPQIFYVHHSHKQLQKTIIAAVLYAYTIWGQNKACGDYEGQIQSLSALVNAKNEDAITTLAGIGHYVDTFGKQHKVRTSEAAAIGINLRSINEARVETRKKRQRTSQ